VHACETIVTAARYLAAQGLTQKQHARIHHFALGEREVTFAAVDRYFGNKKELRNRNLEYSNRVQFVAVQYEAGAGSFETLIAAALEKWPLVVK
jgi:hypothetical protein